MPGSADPVADPTDSATHLVLGVMGHVDHGKTALVRALTGIETDRLPEERRRGISIALGFAHLDLPEAQVHLIDMPGHERFVRTLISGAAGVDAVLLVVAANEGIKPQTVEHLEIAALLGLAQVVIAVSKSDLVEPSQIAASADNAAALARGLGLRVAGPVPVSAVTGLGLDTLRSEIAALVPRITRRPDFMAPYLPIDRVFSVAGHGTVVTGTLRGGTLNVGQTLVVPPNGLAIQVRGLQVRGKPASTIAPGNRAAVNLRGADPASLRPGCVLSGPGLLRGAAWLSVALLAAPSAPDLASGMRLRLRLLVGTQETEARLRLLDRDMLRAGESGWAQLHCIEKVAVPVREHVILRQFSPAITVAGGRILDAGARRLRRHDVAALERLARLSQLGPDDIVMAEVEAAGVAGVTFDRLLEVSGLGISPLEDLLRGSSTLIRHGATVVTRAALLRVTARIELVLSAACGARRQPLGRLRAAVPGVSGPVLDGAIARLKAAGKLREAGGSMELVDAANDARLAADSAFAGAALAEAIRRGGLSPPDFVALAGDGRARRALADLLRTGTVVRTVDHVQKREILFHREAIDAARRLLRPLLVPPGLKVSDIGARLGISRKYSVPLLEYFDSVQFTRRIEDRRILRESREG
jgi:selenocysteine-specific elongation factor